MSEFEFESKELREFEGKVWRESSRLIQKIIREHSPIQVGENITACFGRLGKEILRVTNISLYDAHSWEDDFTLLSFKYEGVRLRKKDGKPMTHRNPKAFISFEKDGKQYHMPSYRQVEVQNATMKPGHNLL